MGCSTAILLARRGHEVALFDAENAPFCGASRWNEGKIHLGFMYSADPSLETARKVISGGLAFRRLVEEMLDCTLASVTTPARDLFLCHRESVVSPDSMHTYLQEVMQLVRQHSDADSYLGELVGQSVERLNPKQLAAITDSQSIVAGFEVPERSVSTLWIADRFVDAISAEPRVELLMNTNVTAVRAAESGGHDGGWHVVSSAGCDGPFDWVVNALWQGRIAVDLTAGVRPTADWSDRYRLALFIRTARPVDAPNAIIAVGPFGDVKNYGGRDFYVSWYPLGLMIDSQALMPPAPPRLNREEADRLASAILERVASYVPAVRRVRENIESVRVEGGWVHAVGRGALSDPNSALHARAQFGVQRSGTYVSVDTGKYSTAPWLAHKIADMIT